MCPVGWQDREANAVLMWGMLSGFIQTNWVEFVVWVVLSSPA